MERRKNEERGREIETDDDQGDKYKHSNSSDTGISLDRKTSDSSGAGSDTRITVEPEEEKIDLGSFDDITMDEGKGSTPRSPPQYAPPMQRQAMPRPPPSPRIIVSASTPSKREQRRKRAPKETIRENSSEDEDDEDSSSDADSVRDKAVVDSAVKRKSSNFWEKISGIAGNNKVASRRSSDGERYIKSAKQIRNMRKKVSVTSQGKSRTSQEDLALAIVEGNMKRVSEVVEAYIALYKGNGFQLILRFRYDIDPRNLVITCVDNVKDHSGEEETGSPKGEQVDMFVGFPFCTLHACLTRNKSSAISHVTETPFSKR